VTPPRLFIFDWDGTLIDSVGRIVNCLGSAAREIGLHVRSEAAYGEVIGLGLPEAIQRLYPELTEDLAGVYRDRYAAHFIAADTEPSEFFPGALDALRVLRSRGHLLAVATGKSRRGLDRVLGRHGLEGFFDATRCADETSSKPDPLMLREIFAELTTGPADSLVVGDTEFDMEMAARAGARRIGVSYGVHAPDRLARHGTEKIISGIGELLL
jgi:phosphoglycolate phosphatase